MPWKSNVHFTAHLISTGQVSKAQFPLVPVGRHAGQHKGSGNKHELSVSASSGEFW